MITKIPANKEVSIELKVGDAKSVDVVLYDPSSDKDLTDEMQGEQVFENGVLQTKVTPKLKPGKYILAVIVDNQEPAYVGLEAVEDKQPIKRQIDNVNEIMEVTDSNRSNFQINKNILWVIVLVLGWFICSSQGENKTATTTAEDEYWNFVAEEAKQDWERDQDAEAFNNYLEEQNELAGGETCPFGCEEYIPGCDIKGNISFTTGEKIYHVPNGEFYFQTTIEPEYGERWFCTEEEARANGWRKSFK